MGIILGGNTLSGTTFNTNGEIINSPNVITDGIILWLDAGNNYSYINSPNYYDCGYGPQYYSSNPGCPSCNSQWKDMSGYGNDLTLYNGLSVSYDNNGGSMNFDGSNDNARLATSMFNKTNGQELTVSVWMKPGRTSGQYQDIIVNRSDSSYNWMLYQHTSDGSIQLHGADQYKSSYIPIIGNWINVTATVTSAQVSTLYINGNSTQTVNGYNYANSEPSLLCIGCFGTSVYEPYLGLIAVAMVYNRALSQAEVIQNFNNGRLRFGI